MTQWKFRKLILTASAALAGHLILYDRLPRSMNLYSYERTNRNKLEPMWMTASALSKERNYKVIQELKPLLREYNPPWFCFNPHLSLMVAQTSIATQYQNLENVGYIRKFIDTAQGKIAFDIAHS